MSRVGASNGDEHSNGDKSSGAAAIFISIGGATAHLSRILDICGRQLVNRRHVIRSWSLACLAADALEDKLEPSSSLRPSIAFNRSRANSRQLGRACQQHGAGLDSACLPDKEGFVPSSVSYKRRLRSIWRWKSSRRWPDCGNLGRRVASPSPSSLCRRANLVRRFAGAGLSVALNGIRLASRPPATCGQLEGPSNAKQA